MYETIHYKANEELKTDLTLQQIEQALGDESSLLWVDIKQTQDVDIDLLSEIFKLHPLTIEDCIMPNARTKLEKFNNYLFMIMFAIESHPDQGEEIKTAELDICLGKNFLITIHNDYIVALDTSKERIRKQSPIIARGADFLLCSIIDVLVDNYFPIINSFDGKVDDISDELFKEPTQQTLSKIYNLKNKIMFLRRTVSPQADMIGLMLRENFEFVTSGNLAYFRNVYDNLVRLGDIIGTSRDVITSALQAYSSVVSNRLNEIMKALTVIATIMMPLTLIASIYGMNFKVMPELSHPFAYPAVLGVMLIISVAMLFYFKRKKWL